MHATAIWAQNHITLGLGGEEDPIKNNACVSDTGVSRLLVSTVQTLTSLGVLDRVKPDPRLRGRAGEAGTNGLMGRGGLSLGGLTRPCPARTEPWALLPAPRNPPHPLSCSAGVTAAPHGESEKAESWSRAQRNGLWPQCHTCGLGDLMPPGPWGQTCSTPPSGRPEEAALGLRLLTRKSGWWEHEGLWGAPGGWHPWDRPRTSCHCSVC